MATQADLRALVPELSVGDIDTEFREFEAAHSSHKIKMAESFDFYMGRQWHYAQAADLLARGQFPLVINKVYPAIQSMLAYLTAERPAYIYLPHSRAHLELASIHNQVGRWIWDRSNGNSHLTRCVLDMLVAGVGWMQVYIDPRTRKPKIRRIPTMDVYADPASQGMLCEDASAIYIRKIVTKRELSRLYPEWAQDIKLAPTAQRPVFTNSFNYQTPLSAGSTTGLVTASGDPWRREDVMIREDLVQALERYSRTMVTTYRVTERASGKVHTVLESDFSKFMSDVQEPGAFIFEPQVDIFIRQTNSITNTGIVMEDLVWPMDVCPLVPFFDNHMDNPMSEGEVENFKGLSMERNKRRSLIIHNATTSSNSKWILQEGSTPPNEFENKASVPGAILYWRKGYEKPEPVFPLPMPEVLHYLEAQSDKDLQDISGIWGIQQGDPKAAPNHLGALLALDEYGARRPALKQRQMDDSLSQLGQVVLNLSQMTMREEEVLRLVGPDGREAQLLVNANDGERIWNDISMGEWTVICKGGSTLPSNREAKLQKALEMKREGIYDDIAVLKYVDDPESSEIIERKSIMAQMAQQNQQLQQSVEQMGGQLSNMEQMVQALQRELAKVKATEEINSTVVEVRERLKAIREIAAVKANAGAMEAQRMLGHLQREVALSQREDSMAQQEAESATRMGVLETLQQQAPQSQPE